MKIEFTQEELEDKINVVELEDVTLIGEYIEKFEEYYLLVGTGIVDGESYRDFKVEVTLKDKDIEDSCRAILEAEWDFYDFIFVEDFE